MEKLAVVLTGKSLPQQQSEAVWAAAAKLFKLEPDAFKTRILARCPLTIREASDSAEVHRISAALVACGAQVEIVESDGKWTFQQEGRTCGPVPLAYLKQEHQVGRLSGELKIKEIANANWTTLANALGEPAFTLDVPLELEQGVPDDEPPPLPRTYAHPPASPTPANAGPIDATPTDGLVSQNLLILVSAAVIAVLALLFKGMAAIGIASALIVSASAVWVYLDATKHGIGAISGKSGLFNLSAGAWGVATLLLWIIAFPAYLIKRGAMVGEAKSYPVWVSGRPTKAALFVGVGVLWTLATLAMYRAGDVPTCDSPEVIALTEKIIRDDLAVKATGIKINGLKMPAEQSYNASAEKRVCRAMVSTELDEEPITYSVEWHDKSKSYIWVSILK